MQLDFSQITDDYSMHDFFKRYVQSFIPPWFDLTADEIHRNTGRDFKRMWAWAFDQLMLATETPYEWGAVARYSSGLYGDIALGTSSRVSEIYKTSFVHTVEWFAQE